MCLHDLVQLCISGKKSTEVMLYPSLPLEIRYSPGCCDTTLTWISSCLTCCSIPVFSIRSQNGRVCPLLPSLLHPHPLWVVFSNLMELGTTQTMLSLPYAPDSYTQPPTHIFLWVSKHLKLKEGWNQTIDPFTPKFTTRDSELRPE